jgi:hypothetical protein
LNPSAGLDLGVSQIQAKRGLLIHKHQRKHIYSIELPKTLPYGDDRPSLVWSVVARHALDLAAWLQTFVRRIQAHSSFRLEGITAILGNS